MIWSDRRRPRPGRDSTSISRAVVDIRGTRRARAPRRLSPRHGPHRHGVDCVVDEVHPHLVELSGRLPPETGAAVLERAEARSGARVGADDDHPHRIKLSRSHSDRRRIDRCKLFSISRDASGPWSPWTGALASRRALPSVRMRRAPDLRPLAPAPERTLGQWPRSFEFP